MMLRRLFGGRPEPPHGAPNTPESWQNEADWLVSWGSPFNVVAGESHRQAAIRSAAGKHGRCLVLVNVTLEPEPENRYDANAVRASIGDLHVGYLRAPIAAVANEVLAGWRGPRQWVVAGVIRGGGPGDIRLGVHVWLERRIVPCPPIPYAVEQWSVPWPPFEEEIASMR